MQWASTSATIVGAVGAALYAVISPLGRIRNVCLAVLLAYFSADDALVIHERAGAKIRDSFDLTHLVGLRLWTVVYLPLLVVMIVLLALAARDAAEAGGLPIVVGTGFLIFAVALEVVGIFTQWLDEKGYGYPGVARQSLEEAVEYAGWAFIATGLLVAFAWRLLEDATTQS